MTARHGRFSVVCAVSDDTANLYRTDSGAHSIRTQWSIVHSWFCVAFHPAALLAGVVGRLDRGALQRADRPPLLDLLGTASHGAATRVHIGARTDCAISTERVCM
jgi:hypothetical protein